MITGRVDHSLNSVYEAMFRLETCQNYVGPLLNAWNEVLLEDNRRGVMQGQQGDGTAMVATKYRTGFTQIGAGSGDDLFFDAQGKSFSNFESAGMFHFGSLGGIGPGFKPSPSDSLTTKQYKQMSGPPLAPRGAASRVISNYRINILTSSNQVGVEGGWDDVFSKKGVPFLPFHFFGATFKRKSKSGTFMTSHASDATAFNLHELPIRNLIGLRRWGKTQATKELNAWIKWLLTVAQPEYFGKDKAGHAPKYVRRKR